MRRTTIACRLLLLFLFYMYAGNLYIQSFAAETEMIVPGGDWRDTDGKLISATEGGIIKVGDLYYLWGMDRSANNYTFVGVNLYSSSDLKNWKFV
ncbi:MAG: beta-xylosidase, partial [Fibrobacter sp.]|nr:beta-xylosidase [Fibrobacter sp.]